MIDPLNDFRFQVAKGTPVPQQRRRLFALLGSDALIRLTNDKQTFLVV
jgi:hypothetical protein